MQTNFFSGLTKKERKIAELITDGKSNREISEFLGTNEKTVKFHISNIYKKLGTPSRAKLIVQAFAFREEHGEANV